VTATENAERVFREESGRILATLIRVCGDFDLAEDAPGSLAAPIAGHAMSSSNPVPGSRPRVERLSTSQAESDLRRSGDCWSRLRRSTYDAGVKPRRLKRTTATTYFTCCHPALAQEAQVVALRRR
jgi:RNA polymerase sigma-70 factor (ECF subfamily)